MNAMMGGFGRVGPAGSLLDNVLAPWFFIMGVSAVVLLWCYIREKIARVQAQQNYESARAELQTLKSRPEIHEFRLERYELVWFPTVSVSSCDRMILGVSAGVPHCRGCLTPLALASGQWSCQRCSAKHPESLGDLMVLDSISKQALTWFQERHPGFRTATKV